MKLRKKACLEVELIIRNAGTKMRLELPKEMSLDYGHKNILFEL
jgi:hypothetical protein